MTLAIAIGKFDALHSAHRALLERAAACAQPALLHFSGMAEELGWDKRLPLVGALERERVLKQWSAALGKEIKSIAIPFADVRRLNPEEFIRYLQEQYPFVALVTGDNFRFAYQRAGTVEILQELGRRLHFRVETVSGISDGKALISSSRIREAIEAGDCAVAQQLLGRPYAVHGRVVEGDQRGRRLGFPTANIQGIDNLIPAAAVYAAFVRLADQALCVPAAVNIGYLPSIADFRPLSVEAHLIDWSGDCYDEQMTVYFIQRLREEQKFESLDALQAQIADDVAEAGRVLAAATPPALI